MFLLPIALIIVVSDFLQFIGWVATLLVCVCIVLDGINTSLHCSIFHMKLAINRVPLGVINFILRSKLHLCIVIELLIRLF